MEILRLIADFLKNYGKGLNLPPFLTELINLFSGFFENKNPPFTGVFGKFGGNGGNGGKGGFDLSSLTSYISPIIENLLRVKPDGVITPDFALSPISDIADKDIVYSLNRYFAEAN